MQRLGSNSEDMRDMNLDDTFLGRIKLLVIMLKTFLGDYPIEGYRQKAILKNAEAVHKVCEDWNRYILQIRSATEQKEGLEFDHIFHQRVSLLATMAMFFSPETQWAIIARWLSDPIWIMYVKRFSLIRKTIYRF